MLPLAGILGLCGFLFLIVFVSAWNYFDVTLMKVSPASDLSEPAREIFSIEGGPSGAIEWSFHAGEVVNAPPLVHKGTGYIVSGQRAEAGQITALDLTTGLPVWTYTLLGVSGFRPTVAGDLLYAVTRDGRTIALERNTGREEWTYDAGEILIGSPIVRNGVLYVAANGVHALDALTGDLLWIHETEGGKAVSPLAYSQGIIAVMSEGNHLNLIDAVKAKRRRTTRLWFGGAGAPAILGDTVVVSGDRGSIQTVNLHARDIPLEKALRFWWTKAWIYKSAPRPPDPVGYIWHHRGIGGLSADVVATADERLYFVVRNPDHSSMVTAVDANSGAMLWNYSSETQFSETAVLSGGSLFVGDMAGSVSRLDDSTGEVTGGFTLSFPVSGVAAATGDTLLVTSEAGTVHLIR